MTNRQNSHFGSDGYKELYANQEAAKRDGKPIQNRLLSKLKDGEYRAKKRINRASKSIVPSGASIRSMRDFR